MAQKSRQAIKDLIPTTFPSGTGNIEAVDVREIETDIADSFLNLITDSAYSLRYSGSVSTGAKIDQLEDRIDTISGTSKVLRVFRTNNFISNNISVGQNIGSPTSGVSVTVAAKSGRDFLLTITFPSVPAGEIYVPVLTWVMDPSAGGWNANNDIFLTSANLLLSSIQVSGRNLNDNPEGHIRIALLG